MQFVQGTIKNLAKGEGGKRRLLLERKDGSEFVVQLLPDTEVNGIGTLFRSSGFEKREAHLGRDVYEQVDPYQAATVIDNNGVAIEKISVDKCSIELAALINLSSQLLNQSVDKVLTDITSIYKKL